MKPLLWLFTASVCLLAVAMSVQSTRSMPRQVTLGEHRLRIDIRGQGSPAVVFDCFGLAPLEIWNRIQPELARYTKTVAYDHSGYWGSEPGATPRDARRIATELRAALRAAGVEPPFVLAGYSFGGPYSRVFASMFPDDVAGLVLIDPTQEGFIDWLHANFPEANGASPRSIRLQNEQACARSSLDQARAARLPDVPITLLTGVKPSDMLTRYVLPRWLESHRQWLAQYPQAKHLITTNSGHDVVFNEPELVIQSIREMLDADKGWRP